MKIICPICDKYFFTLTSHLKTHNVTVEYFKTHYPDYVLHSEEFLNTRKLASEKRASMGYESCKCFIKEKNLKVVELYTKNPKHCETCGIELSFDKRKNRFCKHCKAKYSRSFCSDTSKTKSISCAECGKLFSGSIHRSSTGICLECKTQKSNKNKERFCKNCNEIFITTSPNRRYCDSCYKLDRKSYQLQCLFEFSIKDYPEEFDTDIIKEIGWYSASNYKDNPSGVSRDHKYSIADGFKNGIDPCIIKHPANCELMTHTSNQRKGKRSSISIDELLNRIKEWDEKYKIKLGENRDSNSDST